MSDRHRNGETHGEKRRHATAPADADVSGEAIASAAGSLATAALVLGGIALLQPELIPGMALGAGVALLSGRMPKIAGALRPALKAAVQAAYSAAEVVAQAAEELQDMIAEARAEHEEGPSKPQPPLTH
ncbi:MAG: hypothetical protein ACLQU2_01890 [Candidatus Binataceae bacterium]